MMKTGRSWLQCMDSIFQTDSSVDLTVVDLFCGAGGLSLGFGATGFGVVGVDLHPDAVATYVHNLGKAFQEDLTDDVSLPCTDVIIAGPPCQPWSRAGRGMGARDERDGLALVEHAVLKLRPSVVVVENVPDLRRRGADHLDGFKARLMADGYVVAEHVLNAADYGVPQNRQRLVVTAVTGVEPLAPPAAWSRKVTVREAIPGTWWRQPAEARLLTEGMSAYIARYERASGCRTPRDLHLDRPARTLTARNLAGATGDMMRLRLPDGRRRTLTVREAARLQSFPDWFRFRGSRRSQFEQIGNAVPPLLGYAIAQQVRAHLENAHDTRRARVAAGARVL